MTKYNNGDNDGADQTALHDDQLNFTYEDYKIRTQQDQSDSADSSILINASMHQTISTYKRAFRSRSLIVDILVIFFGIGTWIGINSTYLQLPLLVDKAPEKWSLPSYLVVVIQMANIAPLSYTIVQKFKPNLIRDSYMICFVLIIGAISSLMAAFFYHKTAMINGSLYSVALFILVFFLALVGCTSSVLFMPYMGRFKEIYLITYFIGEGLSGFLPSIVTLIQGIGGNAECILINNTIEGPKYETYRPPPLFSTRDFYIFVFSIMLTSCIAFILLDKLKICKKHYAAVTIVQGNNYVYDKENNDKNDKQANSKGDDRIKYLTPNKYNLLMILMAAVCFFGNGVFPSIQSYSCLPYGNLAYHLTVSLSSMANPLACFLAVFLPHTSIRSILVLFGFSTIITIYAMTTAVLSPYPPLVDSIWGTIFVVISWTILVGLVSYIKLCITAIMRSQEGKSLVWIGAISQAGSAIGSVFIFALINYTGIFQSYMPC